MENNLHVYLIIAFISQELIILPGIIGAPAGGGPVGGGPETVGPEGLCC